jgi:hypothetical protein
MALKTAVVRQWLSRDHVVTQTRTQRFALKQRNGVLYAVRAEMQ